MKRLMEMADVADDEAQADIAARKELEKNKDDIEDGRKGKGKRKRSEVPLFKVNAPEKASGYGANLAVECKGDAIALDDASLQRAKELFGNSNQIYGHKDSRIYDVQIAPAEVERVLQKVRGVESGSYFATAGQDGEGRIWHAGEGIETTCCWVLRPTSYSKHESLRATFGPSHSRQAALGTARGIVSIHELDPSVMVAPCTTELCHAEMEQVYFCDYLPGGDMLVSGCDDSLKMWDLTSLENISECAFPPSVGSQGNLRNPDNKVFLYGASLLHGSRSVAAAALADGSVRVCDFLSSRTVASFQAHENFVSDCCFSTDSIHSLLTSSGDGTTKLWDSRFWGRPVQRFSGGHTGPVYGSCFLPGQGGVLTWSADGTIRLWDAGSGLERACFGDGSYIFMGLSVSHDVKMAASCGGPRSRSLFGSMWNLHSRL